MCAIVSTRQSRTSYLTYSFRIFGSFRRKFSSRASSISIPVFNRICMGYDETKVAKFFRIPTFIGASTKSSSGGLGYTSRRHNSSNSNNANVHLLFISIPTSVAFYMTLRSQQIRFYVSGVMLFRKFCGQTLYMFISTI